MANSENYLQLQAGLGLKPLAVTAGMLSSGVLVIAIDDSPTAGAVLELANGLEISGFALTENGSDIHEAGDVVCTSIEVVCRSGSATIKHDAAGVAAARRFRVEGTNADLVLAAGHAARLLYDPTAAKWIVYTAVRSINGQRGDITVTPGSIGAETDGAAAAAVAAHNAASDPHPQYTTASEAAAAAPVQSVNGQTGTPVLTAANVGADAAGTAVSTVTTHEAAENPHPQYTTTAEAAAAAPVQSVNGETGAVSLSAVDVGADAAGTAAAEVASHVAEANPHMQYTRSLRYSGTTSGSGTYTVTFGAAFANTPNVTASLIGGTSNQFEKVTSRSTTGFTVTTYTRNVVSVLGIDVIAGSPSTTNGLTVDVFVSSND